MKVFIVAIPLFDATMAVQAYRMCSRSAEQLFEAVDSTTSLSEAFSSPGLELTERLGVEPFAVDRSLFIDLNQYQLLMGMPTNLNIDPSKLICVIPYNLPDDKVVVERIQNLKKFGYRVGMEDFPAGGSNNPLLPLMDYIFIDYRDPRFVARFKDIRPFLTRCQLIIENIPDQDTFNKLKELPNTLFSGGFYSLPITRGSKKITPLKVNALQLINEVNREDFDLTKISRTVERDPSLSISLLRFINSAAVGLTRRVDSIRNAVAILGLNEVRRWAMVAIHVNLADDRPGEITRLSLIRAKFAENLAATYGLAIYAPGLFIAGLFSLLDVILEKPMEEAMNEVAVDDRIREALVERKGPLAPVLDLIYSYERADWNAAAINMDRNKVGIEAINKAFTNALVWYKELLEVIDR